VTPARYRITLHGAVQGVGFRPFLHRLATELGLAGWGLNSGAGLEIEVEGPESAVLRFLERLDSGKPPPAVILTREMSRLAPAGYSGFVIRDSDESGGKTASILPDLATCPECLEELLHPGNRRYGYPFTNCTHCGPRYTIVLDIPYDRRNTTMRSFELCPDCLREYTDPADRRFHAQPNACPVCGPRLSSPVAVAAQALRDGKILAMKGIGGFQLLVDARNADAVQRLRERKHREEKPFAVMAPSLEAVRRFAIVSPGEAALLQSSAAPIVLLEPLDNTGIAPDVARSSPFIGAMLPYSPLHHLLMREHPHPVVATSGNRSDEPIAISEVEARERLSGVADEFLTHDRPIARPCDDSVARVSRGSVSLIRRARGYAPLPVRVNRRLPPVLAVGGHLKNTVAIAVDDRVFLSQHVGDLDTAEARESFERAIEDLCKLYSFRPEAVVCDLHPDYASSQWAGRSGLPVLRVQHHHAHLAACAAENDVSGPCLGVAWDGSGYGLDGTVWGGEMFLVDGEKMERIGHLRRFRLPGGEAAVRDAWRCAASLQVELGLSTTAPPALRRMIEAGVNSPWTTSVGRLFDAVAALCGVARKNRFEGQAAMQLERAIGSPGAAGAYPLPGGDWEPLVRAILGDHGAGAAAGLISARFHNSLAEWILATAQSAGVGQIMVSGGVFQNRYLTERVSELSGRAGIRLYTHQRVPANDGGIALGQAVLSASALE